MAEEGRRKVQSKGEITLPKEFREDNGIESGDYVAWKRHSRDSSKIIIETTKDSD
jgi:AbrB family looped-hinge helix DNA binding protein